MRNIQQRQYKVSSLDVECSVVVMLDLLAAFGTNDHALIISCLHDMYEICDQALPVIRSYFD